MAESPILVEFSFSTFKIYTCSLQRNDRFLFQAKYNFFLQISSNNWIGIISLCSISIDKLFIIPNYFQYLYSPIRLYRSRWKTLYSRAYSSCLYDKTHFQFRGLKMESWWTARVWNNERVYFAGCNFRQPFPFNILPSRREHTRGDPFFHG